MPHVPRRASPVSSSSSSSSSSSYCSSCAKAQKGVMAAVPPTVSVIPKKKYPTPQEAIDDFWARFTTKAPGKATTVIPQNKYAERAARRSNKALGTTTQSSYDEAAAVCKAKVEKIVKECKRVNQKYRDPHFDLESDFKYRSRNTLDSLYNVKGRPRPAFDPKSVKRVVDIFDEPHFYIDGPEANDVRQGRDGDCWFLAALCILSNKPNLIQKVCVARDEQVGVYGFVFHRDGEWISEIIDDKLYLIKPDYDEKVNFRNDERQLWEELERANSEEQYLRAYQSGSSALYFAQCQHANETWLPLLEKAYAKAHGDYASIEGGFIGEGIEDLTGGVTTELYTTDILDTEHFWNEELLKVNDEFLFGCSTGLWGYGYSDNRKGIVECHAYSVMRAVEIDGQRLVLLRNPWGKVEWKGPWSDGSKEWTAEWLVKLDHRFGDDGNFWISYKDLLRKYQAFDRTRLFGPDWKVTSLWTTLSVPWTLDYHDTYFTFSLAKKAPVVMVLSQLDDRYYRGLEGQYQFQLAFRVHQHGKEDYVVRSLSSYYQSRSANVELELEEGEYTVLLKINATRNLAKLPIEEVIRDNARGRRDKLVAVGMSYDLAHSKGQVVMTPEEEQAKKEAEKREKDKERESLKEEMMKARRFAHYMNCKDQRKRRERRARAKAKAEKKREKAERADARKAARRVEQEAAQKDSSLKDASSGASQKHVQIITPAATPSPESPEDVGNGSGTDEHLLTPSTSSKKSVTETPSAASEPQAIESPGQPKTTEAENITTPQVADSQGALSEAGKGDAPPAPENQLPEEPAQSTEETKTDDVPPPPPAPGQETKDEDEAESEDDSVDSDTISSVSDLSSQELDHAFEEQYGEGPPSPPAGPVLPDEDEFERNPWNAVATVGLRVYYKVSDENDDDNNQEEEEMVKLRVVRPDPYAEEGKKEESDEAADKEKDGEAQKSSKGLDVDDSSKDATLEGDGEQRKKSILSLLPRDGA
ncbi:cysteine proteinase [Xylariomycetidae sp. FL0641]|nr:cysteine proteinase [Xylariomycetidae sp. FL0641]